MKKPMTNEEKDNLVGKYLKTPEGRKRIKDAMLNPTRDIDLVKEVMNL